MKKIPAIIFLVILFTNAAGFYVYYIIELHRIHEIMADELSMRPEHELTRVTLTSHDYHHGLVDRQEIKFKGLMYDIARVHQIGDSVIIYAIHDVMEDDLALFLNDLVSKPINLNKDVTNFIIENVSLLYLAVSTPNFQSKRGSKELLHLSPYFFNRGLTVVDLPLQPPRPALLSPIS